MTAVQAIRRVQRDLAVRERVELLAEALASDPGADPRARERAASLASALRGPWYSPSLLIAPLFFTWWMLDRRRPA